MPCPTFTSRPPFLVGSEVEGATLLLVDALKFSGAMSIGYALFCLLMRLFENKTGALFGALLFVLHPLHVESVSWIAGRKELVSAFFVFLAFFTIPEYEAWARTVPNLRAWRVKYYKGLGTSTAKEAKEYFNDLDRHQLEFEYIDEEDDSHIDLAFNKKLADKRKEWLATWQEGDFVDHSLDHLRYRDFVNKELILFSLADCARSIPSLVDGLKPGQRKIMYACFKRRLRAELKVA